jgi:hypothetical protein
MVFKPPRPARGDHRFVGTDQLVKIIQDRRALDQRLAVIQHQRRHPAQRVERRDLVTFAEGRPRPVFEGKAVKPERDSDATDEGRVVLADEDHGLKKNSGNDLLS